MKAGYSLSVMVAVAATSVSLVAAAAYKTVAHEHVRHRFIGRQSEDLKTAENELLTKTKTELEAAAKEKDSKPGNYISELIHLIQIFAVCPRR
jgi:putative lipoic acid-binding regulatory protein